MTSSRVLLALDAGVRESGWAVIEDGATVTTGVIGVGTKRRTEAKARVEQLVETLDLLVEQWRPGEVAHSLPSGIRWPVPALDMLGEKLAQWSLRHSLPVCAYTSQEVREAMTGHPNASRDQLAYAVMVSLGLIGQGKTTHEWEALAVGHYHLTRGAAAATPDA
jgi:Holliday junction resolvasome RuvABC endonuclease subunit